MIDSQPPVFLFFEKVGIQIGKGLVAFGVGGVLYTFGGKCFRSRRYDWFPTENAPSGPTPTSTSPTP